MKFTRKSYGRLLRADGTQVSQHTVAEEAYERAAVSDTKVRVTATVDAVGNRTSVSSDLS